MADALKDLELVKQVFDKHGVRFFLVYGALLGHYRDGDFLPGDDDVDLAVIDPIDIQTRKKIGWALYDLGFQPQNIGFNIQIGRMEPHWPGYEGYEDTGIIVCQRNFKFTIFFFKEEECAMHGTEYVCTPKLGAMKLISTPKKFYEKPGKIKIHKQTYLTPGPIEDYLSFTYFDNWKDKNDRRHGETYFEMHEKGESLNIDGKNQVIKYE